MRKSLQVLLAASFFMGGSALQASAADIPRPVYKSPPRVVAYYNWTGFYIGGNLGYGWSEGDGTFTINGATGTFTGNGRGWFGGLQAGYNAQFGSFVAGIEADYQWTFANSGSLNGTAGANVVTAEPENPWFATVRGRLGYAADRTLVYITGGALFGRATLNGTVSTTGPFSTSANYVTWTLGGGVEYAFSGSWSAKLEYLYAGEPDTIPVPPGTTSVNGDQQTHLVRIGVNYRFSGPVFSRF